MKKKQAQMQKKIDELMVAAGDASKLKEENKELSQELSKVK